MAKTRPNRRPNKIVKRMRLAFLRMYASAGRLDLEYDRRSRRARFDHYRAVHLPKIADQSCYVCDKQAQEWHHIVYLSRGGDDCRDNIVPLCLGCHKKVHRHDAVRGNRRPKPAKHVPVLIPPVLLMEVVMPKIENKGVL